MKRIYIFFFFFEFCKFVTTWCLLRFFIFLFFYQLHNIKYLYVLVKSSIKYIFFKFKLYFWHFKINVQRIWKKQYDPSLYVMWTYRFILFRHSGFLLLLLILLFVNFPNKISKFFSWFLVNPIYLPQKIHRTVNIINIYSSISCASNDYTDFKHDNIVRTHNISK